MGEARRRKQLNLTYKILNVKNKIIEERELYKKYKLTNLRPDLGMALIPEYPHPIRIGCAGDVQIGQDRIFGMGITGILGSIGKIEDYPMPSLPLMITEGYCFTIVVGKGKTLEQTQLIANLLMEHKLVVVAAPEHKYLTKHLNGYCL